ncbi:unnamed protein product [Pedinophyceae sp. YPF-701]|nr:unnamed protein product [Pedinophyceae sp. YPF-701]
MGCTNSKGAGPDAKSRDKSGKQSDHAQRVTVQDPPKPALKKDGEDAGAVPDAYKGGNEGGILQEVQGLDVQAGGQGLKLFQAAEVFRNRGKLQQAINRYREAAREFEEEFGAGSLLEAHVMLNMGFAHMGLVQYEDALTAFTQARELYANNKGAQDKIVAQAMTNRAMALVELSRYKEAVTELTQALEIWEAQGTRQSQPQWVIATLTNLGNAYMHQGNYAAALEQHQDALALTQATHGNEGLQCATHNNNIAVVLKKMGRHDEALTTFQQAYQLLVTHVGPQRPACNVVLTNICSVKLALGDFEEAEELARRTLGVSEQLYGGAHPDVATDLYNLGRALSGQGKYNAAAHALTQCLTIRERVHKPGHPEHARALRELGTVKVSLGQRAEGEEMQRQAFEALKAALGADVAEVKEAGENIGAAGAAPPNEADVPAGEM